LSEARRAVGPGRVNLIGDHTDYNQGLALPMAIGLGVTVELIPADRPRLVVTSEAFDEPATIPVAPVPDPTAVGSLAPPWARLVAAMVTLAGPGSGGALSITSTVPVGSGLSSSAALAVALAEVFGTGGTPEAVARLCQAAEHRAGTPVGLLDPLVCAGGQAGHAMLIDFATLATRHIAVPGDAEFVVVDSGQRRTVRTSAYATRVAECETAAAVIGPLGLATAADVPGLSDPVLRRRASHVVSECARVRAMAGALVHDDLTAAGRLLTESHRSLAGDFDVSTPVLDDLVEHLGRRPGVFGARMTGAGFGGCVVALTRPGAVDTDAWPTPAWRVRASDGTVAARR
jgi:galactokinase